MSSASPVMTTTRASSSRISSSQSTWNSSNIWKVIAFGRSGRLSVTSSIETHRGRLRIRRGSAGGTTARAARSGAVWEAAGRCVAARVST